MEFFFYAFEVEMEKLMTSPGKALSRRGESRGQGPHQPNDGDARKRSNSERHKHFPHL